MKKLKRGLVGLVVLVMVANVTHRLCGTAYMVGSNPCTDPNNPVVRTTVVMDDGGFYSATLKAIDPNGREPGRPITISLVGDVIPNVSLTPVTVIDPNTVPLVDGLNPCTLDIVDVNKSTAVEATLSFEPDDSQRGKTHNIDICVSDGIGSTWWRHVVTVRPENQAPFLAPLQDAEGGE